MLIKMRKKEKVFAMFGGLCAYTGKPLGDDWQIDHVKSKAMFEKVIVDVAHYRDKITGERVSVEDMRRLTANNLWQTFHDCHYIPPRQVPHKSVNDIENLLPALKIVNHYKRALDLEGFRKYMKGFHTRLKRYKLDAGGWAAKKQARYMWDVANAFEITPDKPFSGKFYFETIKD